MAGVAVKFTLGDERAEDILKDLNWLMKGGAVMYESPITQIVGEIQTKYEEDCLKVVQSYGFTVNKEELTKALQYDRGQYTKGYNDGYIKAIEEFKKKADDRITEFIFHHQKQLTFASGVSYGWRIIDEVAEELKGNKAADEKEG